MLIVRDARKRYGPNAALDGVSLELGKGSVLAVIGANGAGKTTLLKCIIGLLKFEGQVLIDGIDVARKQTGARLSYCPSNPRHGDLFVPQTVCSYADIKASPHRAPRCRLVGPGPHGKRTDALSVHAQRLALALALLATLRSRL